MLVYYLNSFFKKNCAIAFATPLTHHPPSPLPLNPRQDICGALTYISSLVILTADRTLAVGPSEEETQ